MVEEVPGVPSLSGSPMSGGGSSDWIKIEGLKGLIRGQELAKQIEHQFHLAVSSASSSSHDQTTEMLNKELVASLSGALSVPDAKSSVGDTDGDVNNGSTPRKRKRMLRWTGRVRLVPSSNLDVAPDDGFGWRECSQKNILGARYPRGSYRCTYRNTQGCLATKQLQRSDDDPMVLEITYRGRRMCFDRPATIVPPFLLPENQTDSNASIDAAPLQIREVATCVSAATSGNNSQVTVCSNSDNPLCGMEFDLKNEESTMGSSDFVPMQSTRDTDTELFPWMMKKDVDPHAALGKLHRHSSHSESEFGSHCSESESEDTDEKMKIRASPEYHRRETSGTAVLEMQSTAEPEVEPFFSEVNEDTASDKVHSYSSEQESEVDSYCSGPEYEVEANRVFLMRGGLDLIEPPEVEEWESAKEICLMHTAISELPKEPRCPSLSSLCLQRNYRLRKLSSSFFNQMPALEVLNLSRTRIRCLPESISQLVSLKRLFLNDCVLLRSISPAIAGLKRLEVFDLEGTKIKNLPREIECLINLTCLEISVSGTEPFSDSKTVIPHGVISSLLHLEELNLDVDANAEWWDTCAEGVLSEVCNLKRLSTFKFSFPTLELLRHFNQLRKSMEHPSLAQFRLCVGNHASRVMNRLPSDIEFELEQCNRFLRYTNGDGVFTDIKDILQQSDAFFLERHANLKKLSELGMDSMDQLKWCVLGECNELEVLVDASDTLHQEALTESHRKSFCLESLEFLYVYYMRNLRTIWKGSMQKGCLSSLKSLTLCKCPELTVIFSSEMLDNLNNLEEVTVEYCPAIKSLISCQTSTGKVRETSYFLPILKKLSLHYVPELSNISFGLRIAPRLERLSFCNCPSLKSLSTDEVSSEHLKKIRGERSWWKDLEWRGHKPDHLDGIFVPIDECEVP